MPLMLVCYYQATLFTGKWFPDWWKAFKPRRPWVNCDSSVQKQSTSEPCVVCPWNWARPGRKWKLLWAVKKQPLPVPMGVPLLRWCLSTAWARGCCPTHTGWTGKLSLNDVRLPNADVLPVGMLCSRSPHRAQEPGARAWCTCHWDVSVTQNPGHLHSHRVGAVPFFSMTSLPGLSSLNYLTIATLLCSCCNKRKY